MLRLNSQKPDPETRGLRLKAVPSELVHLFNLLVYLDNTNLMGGKMMCDLTKEEEKAAPTESLARLVSEDLIRRLGQNGYDDAIKSYRQKQMRLMRDSVENHVSPK